MKRVYHKGGLGRLALAVLAAFALSLTLGVEQFPRFEPAPHSDLKRRAAERMARAFSVVQRERLALGLPKCEPMDRHCTGMLGPAGTEITTSIGSLRAKRTSTNPNFAAAIVGDFKELGLKVGDTIAVGCSGSFPALNVAVYSAVEELGLQAIVIASAGASDYGASIGRLTWFDMERAFVAQGVFGTRSVAASIGGVEDQGLGLSEAGLQLLHDAMVRHGAKPIEASGFQASVDERMRVFDEEARGRRMAAYVNVGGGAVSVGRSRGKAIYRSGINRPAGKAPVDSVIGRFLDREVPVLHLSQVETLARSHQLPIDPKRRPLVGEGPLFGRRYPRRVWILTGLIGLGLLMAYWVKREREQRRRLFEA